MRLLTVNPGSTSCKLSVVKSRDGSESRDGNAFEAVKRVDLTDGAISAWSDTTIKLTRENRVDAVVVRVVHGGQYLRQHALVDAEMIDQLRKAVPFAPNQNPASLAIIEALHRDTHLPLVVALDTAFHSTMPEVASTLAVPTRWRESLGLRRLGFHGLSHAWVARQVPRIVGDSSVRSEARRIVSCHLGGGSSLAAIMDGASIDTTMGYTPLDGVAMTTRSGSLDPGVVTIAMRALGLTPDDVDRELSKHAGLAGISGRSGDMRDLLQAEALGQHDASLAIEVYVYRVRGAIAAMATSMGGLDVVAFTGGIGAGSAEVRDRICSGLEWLGVSIDCQRNESSDDRIVSKPGTSPVVVSITSREEFEMAFVASTVLTA